MSNTYIKCLSIPYKHNKSRTNNHVLITNPALNLGKDYLILKLYTLS